MLIPAISGSYLATYSELRVRERIWYGNNLAVIELVRRSGARANHAGALFESHTDEIAGRQRNRDPAGKRALQPTQ